MSESIVGLCPGCGKLPAFFNHGEVPISDFVRTGGGLEYPCGYGCATEGCLKPVYGATGDDEEEAASRWNSHVWQYAGSRLRTVACALGGYQGSGHDGDWFWGLRWVSDALLDTAVAEAREELRFLNRVFLSMEGGKDARGRVFGPGYPRGGSDAG